MIETDRLVLRPWRESDRPMISLIFGDAEVMEFSDEGVIDREGQTAWFDRAVAARGEEVLFGPLAITLKNDDRIAGYIGLSHDPKRVDQGDAEIGFRLVRSAWGRGYATEAASAIIDAARDVRSVSRIVAIVDPHNAGSLRVLEKLGMIQIGEVMFAGYDYPDHVYVRDIGPASSTA